jgi:TRAP-type C4-dicarboxylate transport system permease small subunit
MNLAGANEARPPRTPAARVIDTLAMLSALFGGLVLAAIAGMTCWSIAARALGYEPVSGDFELVQLGLAVSVAAFLPWCQMHGGNIIVDFFTARAAARTRQRLDAAGGLLVAAVMALVVWRTAAGALSALDTGEETMILGVPLWLSYALMTPGLAMTALVALFCAWQSWRGHAR